MKWLSILFTFAILFATPGAVLGQDMQCNQRSVIVGVLADKYGEALADGKVMHHVADLFETGGSDVWYEREASELLPAGTLCTSVRYTSLK